MGALKHRTGTYTAATVVLAVVMAAGAAFAAVMLPIISHDSTMRAPAEVAGPATGSGSKLAAAGRAGGTSGSADATHLTPT